MNIGELSVWVGFLASVAAGWLFFAEGRGSNDKKRNDARAPYGSKSRRAFWVVMIGGIVASADLLWQLLSHQFQYAYVAHYSSRILPTFYLISAFWAGQEGTFLLWALIIGVMGTAFMRFSKTADALTMSVVSAYSAFLYLLMIVKSPFEVLQSAPADGSGLNPLLQNPWMVIHPPILFVGYAATVFPFALAVSALARRNYVQWNSSGFAWTLFATLTLGAGIIIGGFWAYEVLGWGGYWGWDPVENSSLVPWLTLLASVHAMLIQKAKGSLARTNLFLGMLSFLLVLYATFLTRSGVLADFSVHSFVDLGISGYLVAVIVIGSLLAAVVFLARFKSFDAPPLRINGFNRELALLLSLIVLLLGALFTFVGMSSPILTGLVGKASQVDTSFYNRVNMPVAIGISLLLGVTPFLGWSESVSGGLARRFSLPLSLTGLSCAIAYVAGVTTFSLMLFVGSAAFGLISNVIVASRQYRSGWSAMGGPVAHCGVALLLIGVIGSGSYDETKQAVLKANEPQSIHGYQFTFRGVAASDGEKSTVRIDVADADGKNGYVATPSLYFSTYNQAMLREPDIKVYPMKDLYISPIELHTSAPAQTPHPMVELTKGESKQLGEYQIRFVRFEMAQHGQSGSMSVGAVLDVAIHDEHHEVIPSMTITERGQQQFNPSDLPVPQNMSQGLIKPRIALTGMSVEEKKVMLQVMGLGTEGNHPPPQELVVEISTKPLMMVVWTGVVLILAGTTISLKRRLESDVQSVA